MYRGGGGPEGAVGGGGGVAAGVGGGGEDAVLAVEPDDSGERDVDAVSLPDERDSPDELEGGGEVDDPLQAAREREKERERERERENGMSAMDEGRMV